LAALTPESFGLVPWALEAFFERGEEAGRYSRCCRLHEANAPEFAPEDTQPSADFDIELIEKLLPDLQIINTVRNPDGVERPEPVYGSDLRSSSPWPRGRRPAREWFRSWRRARFSSPSSATMRSASWRASFMLIGAVW
jgi:hypothetical protein